METTFDKPQRQSSIGVLVMFVDSLQKFGRAFFPIIVIYFFKAESLSKLYLYIGLVAIVLIIAVIAYLSLSISPFILMMKTTNLLLMKEL